MKIKNQITNNHLNQIIDNILPMGEGSGTFEVDETLNKEFWNKLFQAKSTLVNTEVNLMLNVFISEIEEDVKEKFGIDYKFEINNK